MIEFVNAKLFPYLKGFHLTATNADTLEYKIGEIFSEIINKFRSGYVLRDVLEIADNLSFNTQAQKHELSDLYETRIKKMGNAGRNGGEYYTPRPLIRAMIKVTAPKIGETIYDGAAGSAGFLCEAFTYLMKPDISADDYGKSVMGKSVNQANISGSKLKNYPILLPPLATQIDIANHLSEVKAQSVALRGHYQKKLTDLDDLRQSLLQKAFAGELT